MNYSENHVRCRGLWLLIVGVLVILNSVYSIVSWGLLVGLLIAVWGFLKLVAPGCYSHGHSCRTETRKAPARKKKR